MKKKIAIVGFGFMGVVHAKNILASDKFELCGIVDNREGNIFAGIESTGNSGELELPLEQLKKIPVYKTLKECADAQNPDAVSICVPLFLHYELAKESLELELDLLLEKPFCPEVWQCQELIDLAKEKKRVLMVAHCIRFAPEWQFLADCIKDKRYGELKLLTTTRMGGEPTWGVWKNEKIKKTCGGALLDLLIHDIDFANSCLGVPADINVNLNCNEYWEIGLKYPDNPAQISIRGGFLYRNTAFASDYAATFENGSIRYSTRLPGIINVGTDTSSENVQVSGDMYANELNYFANCIIGGKTAQDCLPETSLQTIEVCRKVKQISEVEYQR
jgi:predicted dehydrogenase